MHDWFRRIPPWWVITRAELAKLLGLTVDVLAQKHMQDIGPQPLPREWLRKPKSKRVYRKVNVVAEDPEQYVASWLEARHFPSADTLVDRMETADRMIRFNAELVGLERRDIRGRPRLWPNVLYDLHNPNDDGVMDWEDERLDRLVEVV